MSRISTSDSGIAANGGTYTSGNPGDGSQAAFIKNNGLLSQIWSASAGTYTLSFEAAQRGSNNDSYQQLRVNLRPNGGALSVKTLVWCGNQICEERDATGSTTKRYFAEGEQRIGGSDAGNYYYSRDHLGSIREVTDSSGNLVTQLDYDVWGNEVVVSGAMNIDFGFTGHYLHQASGLNLSMYRAYNPTLGRWISRDPLENAEMSQGPNLYAYVQNDPVNKIDPLGLLSFLLTFGPDAKGIPHTAVWVVDSSGSTFYSFDSAGLHRFDNPSSFLADELAAHGSVNIDLLDPSRLSDEALRGYYENLIDENVQYLGGGNGVCNSQARDAIAAASAQSDGPYEPTDSAFTPGLLRIDLEKQDFIDASKTIFIGGP